MRVLLLGGLAFEALTDPLQGRSVVGVEDFAERTFGFALALVDELHHLDCGDQNGGDEFFERTVLFLPQRFDGKALCLHGPEQLLDGPAQAIEADDAARVGDVVDLMGREQEPKRRLFAFGGIDLAADDQRHADGFGQAAGVAVAVGAAGSRPCRTDRQLGVARGPARGGGSSTVIAPASSQASVLENKVVPSARRRSWAARTSFSTSAGLNAKHS